MTQMNQKTNLLFRMSAAQSVGTRADQQDSVNASRPEIQQDVGVLCVLSDGMGGLSNGKEASQRVVDTMVSTFHRSSVGDTPEQILLRGCAFSQQAVREIQKTPGECGATLVAVLIRDGLCSYLSVGDSRIYLFRGGALIQLTRDMSKGARIDAQIGLGRMPEEARTDAKRRALTGYIGMEKLEKTDRSSHPFPVIPGDRILMVSDGVYETLSEAEISATLTLPEEQVCDTMIARVMAKARPEQDNCTAAMIDCTVGTWT